MGSCPHFPGDGLPGKGTARAGTSVCSSLKVNDYSWLGVMAGPGRLVCGRDGGHGEGRQSREFVWGLQHGIKGCQRAPSGATEEFRGYDDHRKRGLHRSRRHRLWQSQGAQGSQEGIRGVLGVVSQGYCRGLVRGSRVGSCEAGKRGLREFLEVMGVTLQGSWTGWAALGLRWSHVGGSREAPRRPRSAPFCPPPAAVPAPRVPRPPAVRRKSQDGGGGSSAPPPLPTPGLWHRPPAGLSGPAPPPRAGPRYRLHRLELGHAPIVPPLPPPRRSFLLPGWAGTPPPRMAGPAPPQP